MVGQLGNDGDEDQVEEELEEADPPVGVAVFEPTGRSPKPP
jgi:hypothetical protein